MYESQEIHGDTSCPFRLVIDSTEKCLTEDENGTNEINDCGDIGSISVENRDITRGYRKSKRQKKVN